MAHIKSGRLKALAVTGSKRTSSLADLPTFAEAGYPGVVVDGWRAIFSPAGTPRAVIDQINRELARIAKLPDVQEKLAAIGTVPVISTPEHLGQIAQSETRKWASVVKEAKVTLQ
jgi:tripartite-type tricarboxylate transporter receptor subunit TctC